MVTNENKKYNNLIGNSHKKNILYLFIGVLSIFALVFSLIILVEKLSSNSSLNNFCSAISPSSECGIVQNSIYAQTLGIDNAWFGIVGFAVLAILSFMQCYSQKNITKLIIMLGSIISGILAIRFIYLQIYIIHAYCIFCIFVDTISVILLGIVIYLLMHGERKKSK